MIFVFFMVFWLPFLHFCVIWTHRLSNQSLRLIWKYLNGAKIDFQKKNQFIFNNLFSKNKKNILWFSFVQGEWYLKDGIISGLQVVWAGFWIFSGLPTFYKMGLWGFLQEKMKKDYCQEELIADSIDTWFVKIGQQIKNWDIKKGKKDLKWPKPLS